jgi:hypothetical protein
MLLEILTSRWATLKMESHINAQLLFRVVGKERKNIA